MSELMVVTREGEKIPFDKERIVVAVTKAAEATQEFNATEARKIAEMAAHFITKSKKMAESIAVE